jgi:hypothetical protein
MLHREILDDVNSGCKEKVDELGVMPVYSKAGGDPDMEDFRDLHGDAP